MSEQPLHEIRPVEKPANAHDISQYKKLRLSGLLTEPQFFGSNYQREANFTEEEWKARLDTPGKATFIAISKEGSPHGHAAVSLDANANAREEEGEKWVGMVTVLGPAFLRELYDDEELAGFHSHTLYTIVGVWVEPSFRRKGIAGSLMKATSEWVEKDTEHGEGDAPKSIVLRVHRSNKPAREVYLRNGFQDLSGSTGNGDPNDEVWMVRHLHP
ncbi:hypothetical protein NMY22_g15773 [Coprinellus aureogranulatus]|nr:hypothetical protein NMY22_g15773 [Coprinellus aureogranulatus]